MSIRRIKFYAPSLKRYEVNGFTQSARPVFVSVSVTGRSCYLNCRHCGKKLLQAMLPARMPENFWRTCLRLKKYGARGVLVSGGVLIRDSKYSLQYTRWIATNYI